MRRTLKLRTNEGNKVSIALEHRGSGMDGTMRRWILEDGYWHCMDSAEIGQKSRSGGEYAFLIAAVSAIAWGVYNLMGPHISSMARATLIHP
jgi:hypothetical protein